MTKTLKDAIAELEKSPPEVQDTIASLIVAELDDDAKWTKQFDAASDEQWGRIADSVRREIAPKHP